MKKALRTILFLLIIVAVTLTLFSCKTGAYWQRQGDETQKQEADIQETNGSEKYIVYAALDSNGDLIASGASTEIAAYAVVGYTGLVAELVVPSQYEEKNITKVLVASPYSSYKCYCNGSSYTGDDARLANQTVVTSIVFGSNVTFVGAGVCAGMVNLETVHFKHVQSGVTITNAFLGITPTITYGA